jgi:hypothetical protein
MASPPQPPPKPSGNQYRVKLGDKEVQAAELNSLVRAIQLAGGSDNKLQIVKASQLFICTNKPGGLAWFTLSGTARSLMGDEFTMEAGVSVQDGRLVGGAAADVTTSLHDPSRLRVWMIARAANAAMGEFQRGVVDELEGATREPGRVGLIDGRTVPDLQTCHYQSDKRIVVIMTPYPHSPDLSFCRDEPQV